MLLCRKMLLRLTIHISQTQRKILMEHCSNWNFLLIWIGKSPSRPLEDWLLRFWYSKYHFRMLERADLVFGYFKPTFLLMDANWKRFTAQGMQWAFFELLNPKNASSCSLLMLSLSRSIFVYFSSFINSFKSLTNKFKKSEKDWRKSSWHKEQLKPFGIQKPF